MNYTKQLLIIILVSLLIWILGYFALDLFSGQLVLSLAIAILSGLLGTLFNWAISQKFLDGFKTLKLTALVGFSATLGLGILAFGLRETIIIPVYCDGPSPYAYVPPFPTANKGDDVIWSSLPEDASLVITFPPPLPPPHPRTSPFADHELRGTGSVGGRVTVKHKKKPKFQSFKYTGTCNGKPIKTVLLDPMIQIPRKH
jgi:hypothetical protein